MREEKSPAVYILASRRNGTLYTGVTSQLCLRMSQHKQGLTPGFASKYDVKLLVWLEWLDAMEDAIRREKQIKKWRAWKIELIEASNPHWLDLTASFCGPM